MWSFYKKSFLFILIILLCCLPMRAADKVKRPKIKGISHMAVYTTNMAAAAIFYGHDLGGKKMPDPESSEGVRYYFSRVQFVEVLPLPADDYSISRLAHIGWETDSVTSMRAYLVAHGIIISDRIHYGTDHSKWFSIKDPEGNELQFVQPPPPDDRPVVASNPISSHIIHVGFLVHNRFQEDSFYHKLLGFRPYWYGGQRPGVLDWVSQQVPDGTDWLEYMLIPVQPSSDKKMHIMLQSQLGVMNHFSLGVQNMEAAVTLLARENRLPAKHTGPQIGLDGKWQYNLFDQDGTRVELMEFQPVIRPCCSNFTAASPVK
jgi:catechol 2,3-dioxygenase-like lactoylglutathione lyase family enzyme